ncbi:hypothetical protein VA7868_02711 [Vibrio aerogenes CECT 7868]|uniref:Lipoprotein n=1 Tax=Vibrio aerogenes CECT 7868 TaxID=1216006 RepID=A0A1M5ZH84_9VIBR|nr:hypothetical protein [Vibrio aerogenes]SHI23293.1 hypothetical protein VA7868_02711 [Vibrio aerogenes CECT 7868]
MNKHIYFSLIAACVMALSGCVNPPPLGQSMNSVRMAQIYNPDATEENVAVIPVGIGERMENAYQGYVGEDKQKASKSQSPVNFIFGGQ